MGRGISFDILGDRCGDLLGVDAERDSGGNLGCCGEVLLRDLAGDLGGRKLLTRTRDTEGGSALLIGGAGEADAVATESRCTLCTISACLMCREDTTGHQAQLSLRTLGIGDAGDTGASATEIASTLRTLLADRRGAEEASARAAIVLDGVPVIALFTRIHSAVAAESDTKAETARRVARFSGPAQESPLATLLTKIDPAVAAGATAGADT